MSQTITQTQTQTETPKYAKPGNEENPETIVVWSRVVILGQMQLAMIIGFFLLPKAMYKTLLWALFLYVTTLISIIAGNHRMWSHRSYKAKLPMRILMGIFSSIGHQNSIFTWARNHRLHHKYSETDADPHNAKRGFIFAHCWWLVVKKHPAVLEKGKILDVSDLENDGVVMFQYKYFLQCVLFWCYFLPAFIPVWYWGESVLISYFVAVGFRHGLTLHAIYFVNSAAHLWGPKPYDKNINPSEIVPVSVLSTGEGFHNYHHVFPQDYKASEHGWYINLPTMFIDFMAWIGQAYDLRTVSKETILKRKLRTGDGS